MNIKVLGIASPTGDLLAMTSITEMKNSESIMATDFPFQTLKKDTGKSDETSSCITVLQLVLSDHLR